MTELLARYQCGARAPPSSDIDGDALRWCRIARLRSPPQSLPSPRRRHRAAAASRRLACPSHRHAALGHADSFVCRHRGKLRRKPIDLGVTDQSRLDDVRTCLEERILRDALAFAAKIHGMNEGDVRLDKTDLPEQAGQIESERAIDSAEPIMACGPGLGDQRAVRGRDGKKSGYLAVTT